MQRESGVPFVGELHVTDLIVPRTGVIVELPRTRDANFLDSVRIQGQFALLVMCGV
jgi:hypothetical protein